MTNFDKNFLSCCLDLFCLLVCRSRSIWRLAKGVWLAFDWNTSNITCVWMETIGCDIRAWTHLSYKQFHVMFLLELKIPCGWGTNKGEGTDFAIIGVGSRSWMDMTMAWLLLLTLAIRMMYFHFPLHSLSLTLVLSAWVLAISAQF
jgi:hypothetical protein